MLDLRPCSSINAWRGYFCCSHLGLFCMQAVNRAPNASWVILVTILLWGCYMSGRFPASSCAGSSCSLHRRILIACCCIFRNKFSIGQTPLTFWDLRVEMHSLPISFCLFICFREVCRRTHGLVLLVVKCLTESSLLGTQSSMNYVPTPKTFPPWAYWILKRFL